MTSLFPVISLAIVLMGQSAIVPAHWRVESTASSASIAATIPVVLGVATAALGADAARRRLEAGQARRAMRLHGHAARAARGIFLAGHAFATLSAGWLDLIRAWTGSSGVIAASIAIMPPMIGLAVTWWLDWPIERRWREATLIRRLDAGLPVYALPSRPQHMLQSLRVQAGIFLLPALVTLALLDLQEALGVAPPAALAIALVTMACVAPIVVGWVLPSQDLPEGETLRDLHRVCARYGVAAGRALLWQTQGMIVNAAVMGFLPFFRRILLTDALLEALPRRELEAVLAHEVAHVRAHHMAWLVLALLALLAGAALGLFAAGTLLEAAGAPIGESAAAVALLLLLASVLAIFGWVSRRFELQADAFAAAHLARGSVSATISASSQEDEPDRPRITRIDEAAVETVCSALEHVAEASGTDPARSSWRHGSIRWRQLRLRRLRGAPLEGLPIDQAVRRLRVAIASVLLLCGGAMIAIELDGAAPGGDHETTP